MLADAAKAQEIFHGILREAAQLAANGEAPRDRLWFFRNARWRCLEAGEQGLQPEDVDLEQDELAEWAPTQIEKLEPEQFATWISAAPDPQRTALALFYLNEFSHRDLLSVTELSRRSYRNCSATAAANSKPGWTLLFRRHNNERSCP